MLKPRRRKKKNIEKNYIYNLNNPKLLNGSVAYIFMCHVPVKFYTDSVKNTWGPIYENIILILTLHSRVNFSFSSGCVSEVPLYSQSKSSPSKWYFLRNSIEDLMNVWRFVQLESIMENLVWTSKFMPTYLTITCNMAYKLFWLFAKSQ